MLKETIKKSMVEAMKSKDKQRKEILSLMVSEITRVELKKKEDLVNAARKEEAKRLNIEIGKVVLPVDKVNEINEKAVITEQEEIAAIEKMAKSARETIVALEGKVGKEDNLAKTKLELDVYMEFLPKKLDENEIKTIIEDVLTKLDLLGTATKQNIGAIRKELNPLVNGKADGKLVTDILNTYIN